METVSTSSTSDLKKLIGKKVQINYISPAQEEGTMAGRLLEVTADTLLIDGAVMKTQMNRKTMKIVSIDYVAEPNDVLTVNLRFTKGKNKVTPTDWKNIGTQISKGIMKGTDFPKGIDWEAWGSQ